MNVENQNNVDRRKFLKWFVLGGLTILFPELSACSPATLPVTVAAEPKPDDYFRNENPTSRERLVSDMADLFIAKTNYNASDAKERLIRNWTWGFTAQDRTNYIAKYPSEKFLPPFNAVTHDVEKNSPKTFVDMDEINRFRGQYTPEQKLTILKAILLHEMEQRTIGYKIYDPPINIVDPVTDKVLFRMKGNLGFVLQTDDGRHTGVDINEAVAEAGAVLSLGKDYIPGSPIDRKAPVNYDNLGKILQPLGITWTQVIKFHRSGDALGFGALIASKLKYQSSDRTKTGIVGLTLANLAAGGRSNDFTMLLRRLSLTWPPKPPLN